MKTDRANQGSEQIYCLNSLRVWNCECINLQKWDHADLSVSCSISVYLWTILTNFETPVIDVNI